VLSAPKPAGERAFFEPRFGYDFGSVRVHTGARAAETAQAVQARAFTVGRDVVFGTGQYAPGTSAGRRLLGHELTHVVQQNKDSRNSCATTIDRKRHEKRAFSSLHKSIEIRHYSPKLMVQADWLDTLWHSSIKMNYLAGRFAEHAIDTIYPQGKLEQTWSDLDPKTKIFLIDRFLSKQIANVEKNFPILKWISGDLWFLIREGITLLCQMSRTEPYRTDS
jgi:hypothetical protein